MKDLGIIGLGRPGGWSGGSALPGNLEPSSHVWEPSWNQDPCLGLKLSGPSHHPVLMNEYHVIN